LLYKNFAKIFYFCRLVFVLASAGVLIGKGCFIYYGDYIVMAYLTMGLVLRDNKKN